VEEDKDNYQGQRNRVWVGGRVDSIMMLVVVGGCFERVDSVGCGELTESVEVNKIEENGKKI
jgi:hypothetical protein